MATTATRPASSAPTRTRVRAHPAKRKLGLATFLVIVGSFMPWIDTAVGGISGARGPGLWTFYAAMLGLAGALVPHLRAAAAQAGVFAAVAIALPVWQVLHVLNLVGTSGWSPGPGLVFVFGGGVLAASCAVALWRSSGAEPA